LALCGRGVVGPLHLGVLVVIHALVKRTKAACAAFTFVETF